jgi:hypothetical protein
MDCGVDGEAVPMKVDKGVAIVTVMAIIVVSTALVLVVLYFVFKGTEISGLNKRYQTAREATLGGIDVLTKEMIPVALSGTSLSGVIGGFSSISSAQVTQSSPTSGSDACFSDKMLKSTGDWATGCSNSLDVKTGYDVKFTLSGPSSSQPFDVYSKIIDTQNGNSNRSGVVLEGTGAAESPSGIISVQHFPYMYRIEAQGEKQTNPDERANFTVLYAY